MMRSAHHFDSDDLLYVAHKWRSLLNSPEATDDDRARFEEWINADPRHADVYGQAVTFWEAFGRISESQLNSNALKPIIRERITLLFRDAIAVFERPIARVAAASAQATLAFVVFGVLLFRGSQAPQMAPALVATTYSTTKGEIKSVTLGDGSTITMAAETSIEASYSVSERVVRLKEGVAYFDVESNAARPFSVEAGEFKAKALGTEFDVRRDDGVFRVAVAEGDVEVAYPYMINDGLKSSTALQTLSAGEQIAATAEHGLSGVTPINLADIAAWRSGRLFYDGVPLKEVVSELNRYSETPIFIDDSGAVISELRLRGGFRADDIDGLLNATGFIHPITVDRGDPKKIVIRAR